MNIGKTALGYAVTQNNYDIVKFLIEEKNPQELAHPNELIYIAVRYNMFQITELLIKHQQLRNNIICIYTFLTMRPHIINESFISLFYSIELEEIYRLLSILVRSDRTRQDSEVNDLIMSQNHPYITYAYGIVKKVRNMKNIYLQGLEDHLTGDYSLLGQQISSRGVRDIVSRFLKFTSEQFFDFIREVMHYHPY